MKFLLVLLVFSGIKCNAESFSKDIIKKLKIETAEWDPGNHDVARELIIQGGTPKSVQRLMSGNDDHVGKRLQAVCQQCMIAGDIQCLSSLCLVRAPIVHLPKQAKSAFVTGSSLHADILCSLCKNARDVMCAVRFCVDPDRDKHVGAGFGSVECMQGFCRWQKEEAKQTGYGSWHPSQWTNWFQDIAQQFSDMYKNFVDATTNVLNQFNAEKMHFRHH